MNVTRETTLRHCAQVAGPAAGTIRQGRIFDYGVVIGAQWIGIVMWQQRGGGFFTLQAGPFADEMLYGKRGR